MVRRNQPSYDWSGTQKDGNDTKKNPYGYKERDEIKRQEYITYLNNKDPNTIIYIMEVFAVGVLPRKTSDESGIDNREEYGYGWNEKGLECGDKK